MVNPPANPPIAAPPVASKQGWFRRHKVLVVLGILIILIFAIVKGVSGGGGSTTATPAVGGASKAADKPAAAAGLNTPVRDGKFEFTVSAVACGQASVGTGPLTKAAQGQFCVVSLTAKNIGTEAQMLDASSQVAFDAQSRKFSADSSASIYLGDQANTFLNMINPGNAVVGKVVFDVPKDAKITRLELHDSAFSGGVAVTVG